MNKKHDYIELSFFFFKYVFYEKLFKTLKTETDVFPSKTIG